MLRGKMISDKEVVDDGEGDQTFFLAAPRQRRVGRQEDGKASGGDEQGNDNEPDWLRAQERSIGFGAVGEIGAGEAMTDPEERGEAEVEQIERAILRVGIPATEPENDRRQPEGAEHPEPIPGWAANPGREQRRCPGCRGAERTCHKGGTRHGAVR